MARSKKTTTNIGVTVCDACEGLADGPGAFKGVSGETEDNGASSTSEAFKTGSGARAGGIAVGTISSIRPPT